MENSDSASTNYEGDMAQAKTNTPSVWYLFWKRIFDIIISGILIIVIFPLFVLLAILIKLDSKGPLIIRVRSMKKGGGSFDSFKLRTMVEDADDILDCDKELKKEFSKNFKLKDDPRVTKLGKILRKTSINELPQLFDVFLGYMSLVGPRTIAIDEVERYGPMHKKLLTVRPGMTGLWQISGRHETTYDKRIELDMYYVDNRSFLLDVKILLKTFPAVVSMRGAY